MEDGTSFIYNNSFGGRFLELDPFNDSAKCQGDMPALNEPWDYSKNLISGVNLGGWLVTEPFIVPGLYEPFNPLGGDVNFNATVVDEWTLCEALGDNMTNVLTEHYETFITEKDFAEIAAAGLNWVRIPIGWWLIEVWDGEPFLANVGWSYFLKAITWARKYGLRINLDLHAIPGSQNGYNHSGKLGSINFLNGVMGIANAQRTLSYIRTLAEFISQDEYKNVIPMFSILNEPYAATIEVDTLRHFYYETYNMIRDITGIGEGNGPFITFHDGFTGTPVRNVTSGGWLGFMPGMDRVALDTHPYLCFSEPNNDGITYQAAKPCSYWAESMNTTAQQFGYYMAGEWSLAFNDCGKWLNNVGNGQRYEGTYYIPGNTTAPAFARLGDCEPWTNYPAYNQSTIDGLKLVASGHMDAFRSWFFWTWKTGYSEQLGMIANPVWNYQLGLEKGWIPENPRTIVGICTSLISENGFTVAMSENPAPTLSPWMTGGSGAGTLLDEAMVTSFSAWPPTALQGTTTEFLPTYTPTGNPITMPTPTVTSYPSGYSSSANVGDGWFNPSDTAGQMTPVAGCTYPDPWSGAGAAVPTSVCTGSADARMKMKKRSPSPSPTTPSSVYATITAQPRPTASRQ
ncbi:glycoside hydrolase family 5 protein [Leucosporidium creatinivorum]|uniref:glucan 1,3-beta-glucosidase n=1 Tax=Leucosporidium creatinivorum TaxID=106004 RepID=A0A1Y2FXF6_9BASI|nr:glycoside hydrolase family 5 protein [Leucosporidium creatinivorum]